jgi:transcriptional regulator with XRE-family HTH domain
MTVNAAVRQLRKHRMQTQQVFATDLGLSISGLQNYERDQMPEPRQLAIFLHCAQKANRPDLAKVFGEGLQRSLGIPYSALFYGPSSTLSNSVEYSFDLKSLEALQQCLSRDARYADIATAVIRAVGSAIETLAEREHDPVRRKQLRMIRPRRKEKK